VTRDVVDHSPLLAALRLAGGQESASVLEGTLLDPDELSSMAAVARERAVRGAHRRYGHHLHWPHRSRKA
jgi:hypothetical protein